MSFRSLSGSPPIRLVRISHRRNAGGVFRPAANTSQITMPPHGIRGRQTPGPVSAARTKSTSTKSPGTATGLRWMRIAPTTSRPREGCGAETVTVETLWRCSTRSRPLARSSLFDSSAPARRRFSVRARRLPLAIEIGGIGRRQFCARHRAAGLPLGPKIVGPSGSGAPSSSVPPCGKRLFGEVVRRVGTVRGLAERRKMWYAGNGGDTRCGRRTNRR